MTVADKIRSMDDDELAVFLKHHDRFDDMASRSTCEMCKAKNGGCIAGDTCPDKSDDFANWIVSEWRTK